MSVSDALVGQVTRLVGVVVGVVYVFWVSIVAVVGDYCRADGVCRSIGKIT